MTKKWNKKNIALGISPLIIAIISLFVLNNTHEEFHEHADFVVIIDGQAQDYSSEKYMSIVPCGNDTVYHTHEEAVHLHDNNDDVVHSHDAAVTYGHLASNLDKMLLERKDLRFFINEVEVEDLWNKKIRDLEKVLITNTQGDVTREIKAITNDACIYSELCPERGIAPYENCGS